MKLKDLSYLGLLLPVALLAACESSNSPTSNLPEPVAERSRSEAARPESDGFIPSGTGVEKEPPAPGTGNVQGRVLYNEKPAAGIEVKLCEKFSQFMSGCGGKTYTAKTNDEGEYLIKGVPPGEYEALISKVFDSDYYVFATSGIVSAAKYRIDEGKTYFAPDSSLFKNDLKVTAPKSGSRVGSSGIEIKWDAYPDAAYYKLSLHPDAASGAATDFDLVNRRVDGNSFVVDKTLAAGDYRIDLKAFNTNDVKLAETPNDLKFTVAESTGK